MMSWTCVSTGETRNTQEYWRETCRRAVTWKSQKDVGNNFKVDYREIGHAKYVPRHHDMTRPQIVDEGGLQI
jgi:hypothetical protein